MPTFLTDRTNPTCSVEGEEIQERPESYTGSMASVETCLCGSAGNPTCNGCCDETLDDGTVDESTCDLTSATGICKCKTSGNNCSKFEF